MELQVTNNFSDITSEILALAKMSCEAAESVEDAFCEWRG